METRRKFEIAVSIPWGEGKHEIQPKYLDYPCFGDISNEQMRKVYAPLRVKLGAKNNLHVINNGYSDDLNKNELYITHFIQGESHCEKTPVPKLRKGFKEKNIIDYAVDGRLNCYLIEKVLPENSEIYLNRLLKIDNNGKLIWIVEGIFTPDHCDFNVLKGEFNGLLIDGQSNLYLTSKSQMNAIAKINTETGDVMDVYILETASNGAFINDQGNILRAVYFEKENRRGLSTFNPSLKEEKHSVCGEDMFGLLLFPFGFDNLMNCYVYKVPNVYKTPAIAKISIDGEITHQETFKDLVVRSYDNTIFTCYFHDGNFTISGYYQDNTVQQWSIQPPANLLSIEHCNCKLIKVDENNKFYILSDEQPGKVGTLLIFSEDGTLDNEVSPPLDLISHESSLQPYYLWQVDREGSIYLSLTDPSGFKIIRMSFNGLAS